MPISSPHNDKLKTVRKLAERRGRDRTGWFVAEGEDLLAAADAAGWAPVFRLSEAGSGLPGDEVEPELLHAVSQLGSGTRALAVYEQRWAAPPAPAPGCQALSGVRCLALFGVKDPGNVGTVLRSAHAFGAACVALGPESADPYSPKAVRASMGAIFQVPVARVADAGELPAPRIALVAHAGVALDEVPEAASLLVGGEREGLPDAVVAACEATAHIPIATESLNAAMAATVALYERHRISRHA